MQKADLKNLIFLWGMLLFFAIFTFAQHGHLIIDNGREAYYPTLVLQGKVLYKDIFNIYGPFAYMFNALLFKILGINLNVLYISGITCAYLITTLTYFIARKFLTPFLSFSIGFFTLILGMATPYLFDFVFPYSYGMLYGLTAFLASLYYLLKHQESENKLSYLYLSCFLAGISVANKYDFLPYLGVILFAIFSQKLKIKEYFMALFLTLLIPICCFAILFLQGLTLNDLFLAGHYLKQLSNTDSLKYFYTSQGILPHKYLPKSLLQEFFKTVFPLLCIVFAAKNPTKISSIIIFILSTFLTYKLFSYISFGFIPILITILALINFKIIFKNEMLLFLTISTLAASIKAYWILTLSNYGMYFAGILLVAILGIFFSIYKKYDSEINQKAVGVYLLLITFLFFRANLEIMQLKNLPIKTDRGEIYVNSYYYKPTQEFINYIKTNTKKTDKIVILPEGALINFLTERESDDYFISLIPPYTEVFGENYIIKHFQKTKPEYIVINNWKTQDYGINSICDSYATQFCNYVKANYKKEKTISEKFKYTIYKLK